MEGANRLTLMLEPNADPLLGFHAANRRSEDEEKLCSSSSPAQVHQEISPSQRVEGAAFGDGRSPVPPKVCRWGGSLTQTTENQNGQKTSWERKGAAQISSARLEPNQNINLLCLLSSDSKVTKYGAFWVEHVLYQDKNIPRNKQVFVFWDPRTLQ